MFWIRMFFIPFAVTVIVEMIVALIWGYRSYKDLLTILWVNALTNFSVSALRYLSNQLFHEAWMQTLTIVILEIAVVFSEWGLYRRFLRKKTRFFLFSLCMNAVSYGAGLLIPVVMRMLHG